MVNVNGLIDGSVVVSGLEPEVDNTSRVCRQYLPLGVTVMHGVGAVKTA